MNIRNILVSMTALSMAVAPAMTFAHDGSSVRANMGLHFGKFIKAAADLDANARHELKASVKEARDEMKAGVKAAAKVKVSTFTGTVASISADGSFTLTKEDNKQLKVTTTTSTKIMNRNASGSFANLQTGSKVIVHGTWNSDKTVLTATKIQIVDSLSNPIRNWFKALFTLHIVNGKVSAVSGNNVTVASENNVSYNVDVTNANIVGRNPFISESVSDLKVGDKVQVFGNVSNTSVTAQVVHDLTISN